MSRPRRIVVAQEDPRWQEADRDVHIEVWHNRYQPTVIPLTRDEARRLKDLLENFLGEAL